MVFIEKGAKIYNKKEEVIVSATLVDNLFKLNATSDIVLLTQMENANI